MFIEVCPVDDEWRVTIDTKSVRFKTQGEVKVYLEGKIQELKSVCETVFVNMANMEYIKRGD